MNNNTKSLIKQELKDAVRSIKESYLSVHSSASKDYVLYDTCDDFILVGASVTSLIPFLAPGLKSLVSAETGKEIKTNQTFSKVQEFCNLEDDEIYYLLIITNNVDSSNTLLIFNDLDDMLQFQFVLGSVSLNSKTTLLKGRYK